MNLNLLSENDEFYFDECFPFEESLNNDLKDIQGKTAEELEKQWVEEDEEVKEKTEEYLEYIEDLKYNASDFENDDEYSSSEEIPTCNPWRD